MLKEALKMCMSVDMNNHRYKFDGHTHRQEFGGLELIGMIWWGLTLKSQLAESGILVRLIKWYVNVVNFVA